MKTRFAIIYLIVCMALASASNGPNANAQQGPTPTPLSTGGSTPPGSSSGDPHLRTPDGLHYEFQASGEFVLTRSLVDDFQIQVRQEPWGNSTVVSANTAVAMLVAGHRVGVYVGADAPLVIDGQASVLGDGESVAFDGGGQVSRRNQSYFVIWPDQTTVEVVDHGLILDVVVRLAPARTGAVTGLLGNADGSSDNDLTTSDGEVVDLSGLAPDSILERLYRRFGTSWRIDGSASLFDYAPGTDTNSFTRLELPTALATVADVEEPTRSIAEGLCRAQGVTEESFLEDCILDFGVTAEPVFVESAAAAQEAVTTGSAGPTPTSVPQTAGQVRFVGDNVDMDLFFGSSGSRALKLFHIDITLDLDTWLVTGGSFVIDTENSGSGSREGTVWIDEYHQEATVLGGAFILLTDGSPAGWVIYDGPVSIACVPAEDRDCDDTEPSNIPRNFGFYVDPNNQLHLCRSVDMQTLVTQEALEKCLVETFALLSPG